MDGHVTTTMSSKGQVVLPKSVRDTQRWAPGTRLLIEQTPEGVLLRPAPVRPRRSVDEIVGIAGYTGPVRSLEEMDAAVLEESKRSFLASVRDRD